MVLDGKGTGSRHLLRAPDPPLALREGARVRTGQVIGNVGQTGNASGCHLHFEIWSGARLVRGRRPDAERRRAAARLGRLELSAVRAVARRDPRGARARLALPRPPRPRSRPEPASSSATPRVKPATVYFDGEREATAPLHVQRPAGGSTSSSGSSAPATARRAPLRRARARPREVPRASAGTGGAATAACPADGAYEFRVGPPGHGGAAAGRFEFHDHVFPVPGRTPTATASATRAAAGACTRARTCPPPAGRR